MLDIYLLFGWSVLTLDQEEIVEIGKSSSSHEDDWLLRLCDCFAFCCLILQPLDIVDMLLKMKNNTIAN